MASAAWRQRFKVGAAEILILSVRGDTAGIEHDIDRDPSKADINENPGSIICLVRLKHFEYLTTGDATSDDWKSEPDTITKSAKDSDNN